MLHIKLNAIAKCNNTVANIFPADPPPPSLTLVVKRSNSTFTEQCHVANQIKGNQECSNMVANIFCLQTPPPLVNPLEVA